MILRKTAIAAASVAVILGGGALALATSDSTPSTTTAGTITACVNGRTRAVTQPAAKARCPRGTFSETWNKQGPAGAKGATGATGAAGATGPAGPQGPAGPAGASYTPVTATSTISFINDPDSGYYGNPWATDTITRVVSITRHAAASLSDCPSAPAGNATCYYYTATVSDTGSFVTVAGAESPNASTLISGTVVGSIVGGSDVEFYADSGALQSSSLGVVDASKVSADDVSDPGLYASFFPAGTTVDSVNLPDWSWSYTAPNTCEHWTDAFDIAEGSGGNIAGINECSS
jgi:hypothetical protein